MPKLKIQLYVLIAEHDGVFRAETLRFPALNCIAEDADAAFSGLKRQASKAIAWIPTESLYPLALPEAPKQCQTKFSLEPARGAIGWEDNLELTFDYARWEYADGRAVARVAAFAIDVVIEPGDKEEKVIQGEIKNALVRKKARGSLGELQKVCRCRLVEIRELSVTADVESASKYVARALLDDDQKSQQHVLDEITTKLRTNRVRRVFEMDDLIRRVGGELTGKPRHSVLLVGKSGVGKSAAIHELAAHPTLFDTIGLQILETSGARIVAGMSGFGEWQDRCISLVKAVADKRIVLHLGNLVELMDVGKSATTQQGIASFLRPYISRGELVVVAECTPEQIPLIEREDPLLIDAFTKIDVKEPTRATAERILYKHAELTGKRQKIRVTKIAIKEIDRLHRRYTPYSAYPGRALRFINNYLRTLEKESKTTPAGVVAAFSHETGLPVKLLDDEMTLDLKQTRSWFGDRVVGQTEAVREVVDRLAWIKTELTRPKKPIGSLLFIGPTGVGKTEMAKTLAEYLFSTPKRMVRFDMSEYRDPIAVKRLIGGVYGDEGLLTAKVREQPFCVVLFDEIEKAHPLFFDILLQVMGEGRLTDAKGRVADFCSTVIIMTSNLGVKSFQRAPVSFTDENDDQRAVDHFTDEVRRFVRPELFNRIDRIVPFQPLGREVIQSICRRELDLALKRHGIRYTESEVTMDDDVVDYLAEVGYDERYGARPLKRAIEREVLLPIADRINRYAGPTRMGIHILHTGKGLDVEIRAQRDARGAQLTASGQSGSAAAMVREVQTLRRNGARLGMCNSYTGLANELFLVEQKQQRKRRRKRSRKSEQFVKEITEKVARLQTICQEVVQFQEEICHLEDSLLETFFVGEDIDENARRKELTALSKTWRNALYTVYAEKFEEPNLMSLAIYCEDPAVLVRMAHIYEDLAKRWQHRVSLRMIVRPDDNDLARIEQERLETRSGNASTDTEFDDASKETEDPPAVFDTAKSAANIHSAARGRKLYGVILQIRDRQSAPKFLPESGINEYIQRSQRTRLLIETFNIKADDLDVPEGVERRGFVPDMPPVRIYDVSRGTIKDQPSGKEYLWKQDDTVDLLERIVGDRMTNAAMKILDE